ncbi:hypothetical protein DIS09_24545 [Burkholderia pseudomallei]|nr:hypothetical protein DIS09_24545 [Burkholderia pseudomallei]
MRPRRRVRAPLDIHPKYSNLRKSIFISLRRRPQRACIAHARFEGAADASMYTGKIAAARAWQRAWAGRGRRRDRSLCR